MAAGCAIVSMADNDPATAHGQPIWMLTDHAAAPIAGADGADCAPASNWLGTDDQARDVLARVIYGFRISVLFGLIADRR